jgi:hypothetical protein
MDHIFGTFVETRSPVSRSPSLLCFLLHAIESCGISANTNIALLSRHHTIAVARMENINALPFLYPIITCLMLCAVCVLFVDHVWPNTVSASPKGDKGESLHPPLLPHAIPIMGRIPMGLLWEPMRFLHTYVALLHSMRLLSWF